MANAASRPRMLMCYLCGREYGSQRGWSSIAFNLGLFAGSKATQKAKPQLTGCLTICTAYPSTFRSARKSGKPPKI
eukprot:4837841-Pyramimonas_sp.AAC.1